MEKHPEMEKLKQLQQGKLHGAELLKILRHLEDCDQCYQNLPPQEPQDLIENIFGKENDQKSD